MSDKSISRNSSIELLRILATFGVIIRHYNNDGLGGAFLYVTPHSINEFILFFLEYLSIVAVNVFILISGYYLSEKNTRSILKPLKLIVQLVLISGAFYLINRTFDNPDTLSEFINKWCAVYWFISLYIALYFISPYINIIFNKLNNKQINVFIVILLLVFSVEPTLVDLLDSFTDCHLTIFSFISNAGSIDGYSIVNMVLMYSLGAFIRRKTDLIKKYSAASYLLIYLLCVCINSLLSFVSTVSASYCSPTVILEAVMIFCFFVKQKPFSSSVINMTARNAFAVYLSHVFLFRFMMVQIYVNASAPVMILNVIITCLILYLIGWIIGQVYSIITDPVFSCLQKRINFYKYDTGD